MRLEDIAITDQPEIVQRTLTYHDQDIAAYFRIINAAVALKIFDFTDDKGQPNKKKGQAADPIIIAAICCKEDGSDLYTVDDAKKLPLPLKVQLIRIAFEVNIPQSEGTPKN